MELYSARGVGGYAFRVTNEGGSPGGSTSSRRVHGGVGHDHAGAHFADTRESALAAIQNKYRPMCEHVAFLPVGSTGSRASTTIAHSPTSHRTDGASF
jgi:hypothetical protein